MDCSNVSVAVVGATGAVGRELLSLFESRNFPVSELRLFASPSSAGRKILFRDQEYTCRLLEDGCFRGVNLAFFDASDAVSKEWVPVAIRSGTIVVDNSATFRMEKDVPLVVPEVNGEFMKRHLSSPRSVPFPSVISGPNCVAVPLALTLFPIGKQYRLKRVIVSTYQSTSGAGMAAMKELAEQTKSHLKGDLTETLRQAFPHQIAFNCIPHIGQFLENGFTSEERKIVEETKKILSYPDLKMSATSVRVPTLLCHAQSVYLECEEKVDLQVIRSALQEQEGIVLQDLPSENQYPLGENFESHPVTGARGRDGVYVGRIRKDLDIPEGIHLWIVSDNIRKGAALNAIQVGESVIRMV